MHETHLTTPDLGLIAGTRAALGVGIGLLVAEYIPKRERRAVGWTLLAVGVFTTIPLVMKIFGQPRSITVGNQNMGVGNQMNQPEVDFLREETELAMG
jgi:multisubunit Na+/H+ antiporter MnhB subunit